MASFLYCSPYSYRSSNYHDSNSCRFFSLLKAIANSDEKHIRMSKTKNYYYCDSRKSDNYIEREMKERGKEIIPIMEQKECRMISL